MEIRWLGEVELTVKYVALSPPAEEEEPLSDPFAGTGGSRLPALGWEPLWGRSLLAMGIPVDRPMIGGGSLLAMGIPCWPGSRWCFGA